MDRHMARKPIETEELRTRARRAEDGTMHARTGRRTCLSVAGARCAPKGFRVSGLGFRIWGLGFGVRV